MKRNLPYQRIDKAIIQAFIHLRQDISFEKLTVQDILDEALVSRYTFYAHFHDKYEVAERIQEELYQDFLMIIRSSIPEIDAQSLSSAEHHQMVDNAIAVFGRKNASKLRSIRDIHTETIDFSAKIQKYLSENYLHSAAMGKNPLLESKIYANMALASMEYFEHSNLENVSQTVMESYIYAMLHAIGIHDRKRTDCAVSYLSDLAMQTEKA